MALRRGPGFPPTAVLLFCAVAGAAHAADWRLTDSWSFSLNALNRDNDTGEDTSSYYLRLAPSLNLKGETHGRVDGQVNYSLGASLYAGDDTADSSELTHTLKANAKAELYRDRVFLGANASAGMATRSDTSDNTNPATGLLDGVQTYSFQLSPEFYYPLGRYAEVFSQNAVRFSGSDSADSNDNWSSRMHIGVRNGREFSLLSWSMDYSRDIRYLEERTDTVQSYDANASYRLDRRWTLSSGLGYSESDAPTQRDSNNALNWNIGAAWTPNSRTKANASYGQNYSGDVWDASVSHVSKRTRFEANFSRSLTNSNTIQGELLEPGINPDGTPVLDPVTGLPLLEPTIVYVPTDENFIRTAAGGSVTVTGRRTTVVGSLRYSERSYDESGGSDETTSFRLSANRRLAERLSVTAAAGISDYSSSSADSNTSYDFQVGINRSLGRRSSIGATLNHRVFDAENDTGYSEQRVSVIFSTSFL